MTMLVSAAAGTVKTQYTIILKTMPKLWPHVFFYHASCGLLLLVKRQMLFLRYLVETPFKI
jgi:hypothetical protein